MVWNTGSKVKSKDAYISQTSNNDIINPKEASNGDLAINRRNQQIQFCDVIISRAFDVIIEFAIYKSWRSCFLVGEEICTHY